MLASSTKKKVNHLKNYSRKSYLLYKMTLRFEFIISFFFFKLSFFFHLKGFN